MSINKYIPFLILAVIATVFLASCEPKEIIGNPDTVYPLILGDKVDLEVNGIVTDKDGLPISDASVSIANNHTTTDEDGIFSFEKIRVYKDYTKIKVAKNGYEQLTYSLSVVENGSYTIPLTLNTKQNAKIVAAASDMITIDGKLTLSFPEDCFTAQNMNYLGDIQLYTLISDGSESKNFNTLPGNFQGIDKNNNFSGLEYVFAFEIGWEDMNGSALQVGRKQGVPFRAKVDRGLLKNIDDEISLWYFDPLRALWQEKGIGIVSDGIVEGYIPNDGWWMIAHKNSNPAILSYQSVDENQLSIPNIVTYFLVDGRAAGRQYASSIGENAGYVPRNKNLTAIVYDICGNMKDQFSVTAINENKNIGAKVIKIADESYISGFLIDCNGNPVSHGIIKAGNNLYSTSSDGSFRFTRLSCDNVSEFIGINLKNDATTSMIQLPEGNTDLGYIQLECNDITTTEHITIKIDDEEFFHDQNIKINSIGDSWEITGYGDDGTAIFSIKDIKLGPQKILSPSAQSSYFFNLTGGGNVTTLIGKNEAFITRTAEKDGDFILARFSGEYELDGGERHSYEGTFAVMR